MRKKRGGILNQVIIQLVLVGLIFAIFLWATAGKVNARGVRQQVLEKEIALLIDSSVPGMSFEIKKNYVSGIVQGIEVKDGKIFVRVSGLSSFSGYPYFSIYDVSVEDEGNKFVVKIK